MFRQLIFIFVMTFIFSDSIYSNITNNNMGTKIKFTEKQKQVVVDMYAKGGCSISEIIERCSSDIPEDMRFSISRETIYSMLKELNIPLIRKTGTKHNLVGQKFGYLTVIKMAQTANSGKLHAWRAICQCSNCGNLNFEVNPQSLLRKQTTSCGCRRDQYIKNTGKNSKQYTGYEDIPGKYWGTIKSRAENRGYVICIDIKYAWGLYLQQNRKCALSGLPITFATSSKKSSETTASLDRIDSTKNYIEGNVQWVHKHVNIMKNVYDQNYFIDLCKLIAENNPRRMSGPIV